MLKGLTRVAGTDLLFPSTRKGAHLSDMAMNKVMRDMNAKAVPHGFRSTFRDWAIDHTNFQDEIAKKALAHVIGDKTEQSYLRSEMFEKRRRMMQAWADFCDNDRSAAGSKVVPMKARTA